MILTLIPKTKWWDFYSYLWIGRHVLAIGFYYKGDEVLFSLNPIKWIRGKLFYSLTLHMWFSSLSELNKF